MNNFIKIQTLKTSIFLFLLGLTFGLNAQISVTFETNAPTCNGYTNGSATAAATGGTAPYTYSWSNGQNGATSFGLSGGAYTVNVSDATGASASASVTVTAPDALIASIAFDGDACGAGAGSLAGSATGGTSPYSYAWSNGASGSTVSGLAQGGYYLTATDANSCESVAYYEITASLAVSVSTIDVICNDFCDASAEAIVTGGSAPYSYAWNTGMTGSVAFPLPAGEYCVTVTDGNGCTATNCGTVAEPTAIVTSVTLSGDCDGNTDIGASVEVTGGVPEYSINWSNGATGTSITGLAPNTTYSVTVTDANGCNDVQTFITPNEPSGLALTTSGENETCAGDSDGSATVVPAGGVAPYAITWSTGSGLETINDLAAGNYEVTVSDANGCTGMQTITVAEGTSINVSSETTASACGDTGTGSLSLVPTGGMAPYFFMYENGIGEPTSGEVSNLASGTYNVTVGDAQGCTTVTTVNVPQIAEFTVSASATAESCGGAADGTASVVNVSADAAQPVSYLWDNGSMLESTEGLSAGAHSVTVTDANGCIDVAGVNVAAGENIELSTLSSPSACGDIGTGSISIAALTGTAPFTYTYENGIGNPDSGQVNDLLPGDYNVTVTDANGCSNSTMLNVWQDTQFTANTSTVNASCPDVMDGSAIVVGVSSEATPPLTYLWDNGSIEDNAGNVSAGDYMVTVTDANGCETIETVTVSADDAISAEVVITPGDCTGDMISVNVSATSTVAIDSYVYTVGDETFTTSEFSLDIPAGETVTVTLVVENAAACTGENESTFTAESFEPSVPETFEACLGEDLAATANGGDTYEWTSDDDIFIGATNIENPEINTSIAGEFPVEVTITNAQGCSVTEAVTITVSDTEIMPDPALVSSTQDCDGTLVGFTNANDSAADYEWIFDYPNGEMTSESSYEFPESGIYEVALIPTVSCADTIIVEVEVAEPQEAEFTFETNCEDGFVVVFTDMSSNPDDITDWNWEINGEMYNEQNPSVEFENAGTIDAVLTVSYGDDCVLETMQPVNIAPFNPIMPANQLVDCGGGEEMGLFPNANTDYDYEWSPADGLSDPNAPNPIATVTETTAYMVTITDPETGCTEVSQVIINVPDELPSPMLGDISLCQSENETADATVVGGVNYTWSDDEDFNNVLSEDAVYGFTVSEIETTYYVLIEDEFGCTTTESFTAGAYPIDFDFGSIKFICEGGFATYELPEELEVNWEGDDPSGTPIFEEDFFVGTITNEANCSLQDTLFAEAVIVIEGLEIDANPDTILLGEVSELFVTPDDRFTYEWDNSETLNDAEIHNPTAQPEETTTYTVTVRDGDGCEGELDVQVVVENNCEPFLYFPNAFTPDADGLNDVLYVEGLSLDEVFFAIYNRWGEKVYESNSITEGWDGTFNGEVVCPDVYGYYLRVRCTDGNEIFRKGNVSVLR